MSPAPPDGAVTIEVAEVSRWFGHVVALNAVSFAVGPGVTGLLGPNGAGKSTLLHLLAGFLRPSSGTVQVLGQPTWRNPGLYSRIGLVQEREAVYPFLSGYEFVLLSARLQRLGDPEAATQRAIGQVELEFAQDRLTGTYSKGMKQRVKIAAALVHDPEVLLLDEPFNGADPAQRVHLIDLFREMAKAGRTIVFSSHILEEVERLADRVLLLVGGRLAAAGDFRDIRRLMTDRPHSFRVRTSNNRRLAAALLGQEPVFGIEIDGESMLVRTSDYSSFVHAAPRVARSEGVRLFEVQPTDESLESVFSYLVGR